MMAHCVVLDGQVIQLGPWPQALEVSEPDGTTTLPNPLPDGALEGDFEIAWTATGRLVLASDYRSLRAGAYPPMGDQLDALFKAGLFPPDMAAQLAAVKNEYPKQ